MRKATENQGDTRTLAEYFSPRSKVKDLTLQQNSLPHFTSFLQETVMKPSQVPNRLSHPPPRRMGIFPVQSPELCHTDRLGPPRPYPHPVGPIHSSGFVPNGPLNFGTRAVRPLSMPRDRLDPAQPPGSNCSPQLIPVSQTNIGASYNKPPPSPSRMFHHAPPHSRKDLSNHSLPSHIRRDQVTESTVTLSNSGRKNATVQQQDLTKAQSNDVRSPIQTIQLHRPPMTLSVTPRKVQDVCSLSLADSESRRPCTSQWPQRGYHPSMSTQSSDRSRGSSLPMMHSPVAPYQDQYHKRTPSSEKFIPVVDLNSTSQKRRRESEASDDSAKKLCLQDANSGKAQTRKPTAGNSLSSSLVPPSRNSSGLEPLPKTTDGHLRTEPACGQSTCLEPSPTSCTSLSPKPCVKRQPSMGAKQAYINSNQNYVVKLTDVRSPKPGGEILRKRGEENDKRCKSSTLLSSEIPQKHAGSSPHVQLGSHHSGHNHNNTSPSPVRTLSKVKHMKETRKSDNSTPKPVSKSNSGSLRRTIERNKISHPRRPVVIADDIGDLFTPDLTTYVVCPAPKTAKPKVDGGPMKSPSSEKSCSSSTVATSSAPITGSLCRKAQNSTGTVSPHAADTTIPFLSSPQVSLPAVSLERVKLETLLSFSPKDSELRNSPITSSSRQLKDESVKTDEKHKPLLPNDVRPCALKTDTAASEQTSTSHYFQSTLLERQAGERDRQQVYKEDPIDVELDLGLSFALDMDLTQSSHSSDEEQLLSFQEMMERVTKPPDTPEKGAFSEPSTPGHDIRQSKTLPLPSTTKSGIYKNNLDQMLKEINTNKKAKEIETELLTACKEDLLRIAEYEEAEENCEEGISTEQQEFLQRYSLMSSAIKEVPPGEVVFNLEKFGRIFNQDTLQLRRCMANPQGTAQKTLLWSSPAQLRLHLNIGLFQEAYDCRSPCPTQVTRFLFKMMSVHTERMVSEKILQVLCDIACTAAYQIVKNGSQQFNVWVPGLADVTLVLMNMGVAFVTLFPFESLQPPFTEGDLLEDVYIKSESPSSNKEQGIFPEHNCNNILKYLDYCMGLCPRAYSDNELLLLLTVVGRMGLDTRLILQSSVELYPLQYKIVNNIRDWDTMLPRICLALTDLTDDHHNMCLLVQLLPDNTRGKQLRRHLSLSMISKLLDGTCTYRPTEKEFQLLELRPYLHRMQPSTLLRGMLNSSSRSQKEKEEDMAILDQQAYYLCYSLLTLANEASNFQFFPARQKEQLLFLSSELEMHIKCDIRESEKCLYRSKVKDLVARIYTKWQMLLQRTRPLHGKLYDYWEPPPVDILISSQEEQEMDISDGEGTVNEENTAMEEDEEEGTSGVEENEVAMVAEEKKEKEKEGDDTIVDTNKEKEGEDTVDDTNKEREKKGDDTVDDTNKEKEGEDTIDGTNKEREKKGDDTIDDTNKEREKKGDDTIDDTNKEKEKKGDDTVDVTNKEKEKEGDDTVDVTNKEKEKKGDDTVDVTNKEKEKKGDDTVDDTNKEKEGDDTVDVTNKEKEKEGDDTVDGTNKTGNDMTQNERLEEIEGGDAINDKSITDKAVEPVSEALNQEMPEMECQATEEQIDADSVERTEGETENLIITGSSM
ncbi:SMC5-SMC6 complex localization factor protein 2 isoform X4 [Thunnus albacares]|uniref:SMC5-SMC6 complex localization factor protein 2 isoform X4 n=1 Tax=Thunnus albacares TaxID=8236 RepID=UPI001CF671E3|nr:SMC5-SMC6 complex localization factor protein 2 isoform X4 [Thunnus albacares]